jgi:hypothetical protein
MAMNGAYFNGLDQNGLNAALVNIPGSVTSDYIMFSLNVASGSSADINYGWNLGSILASNGQVTSQTLNLLVPVVKAGVDKGQCQRVWLTVGAAVNPNNPQATSTFANIQTILNTGGALKSTLLANFGAIAAALRSAAGGKPVGFDMDYEENTDVLAALVANVTIALYNQFKCPVTFCPFQGWLQSSWISALQQVYSTLGTQPVVGYNLQTYAGGSGNIPTQWAAAIASAPNTGVANPAAFVWPIVSCDPTAAPVTYPGQVAQKLQGWNSKGASLWATQSLPPPLPPPTQLSVYSAAIAAGIQ